MRWSLRELWSMRWNSFYLTTWTPSWWKHGILSRYQLVTSSGTALQKKIPPSHTYWINNGYPDMCCLHPSILWIQGWRNQQDINPHSCTYWFTINQYQWSYFSLRAKGSQQLSSKIVFWYAAYDSVRKQTVLSNQETKKECMMILQQTKARLVNNVNSRRNTDLSSGIYLPASKIAQYSLVDNKRREKE